MCVRVLPLCLIAWLKRRRYLYSKWWLAIMYLGCTPLHYSAENGHLPVVKYLVDHGADINIKVEDGE